MFLILWEELAVTKCLLQIKSNSSKTCTFYTIAASLTIISAHSEINWNQDLSFQPRCNSLTHLEDVTANKHTVQTPESLESMCSYSGGGKWDHERHKGTVNLRILCFGLFEEARVLCEGGNQHKANTDAVKKQECARQDDCRQITDTHLPVLSVWPSQTLSEIKFFYCIICLLGRPLFAFTSWRDSATCWHETRMKFLCF